MKRLTGIVAKVGNAKTAYVTVTSQWMHPKYQKKTKVTTRFACHDEVGVGLGDEVVVVECRPMSATKYFKVESIVKKGSLIQVAGESVAKKRPSVKKAKTSK